MRADRHAQFTIRGVLVAEPGAGWALSAWARACSSTRRISQRVCSGSAAAQVPAAAEDSGCALDALVAEVAQTSSTRSPAYDRKARRRHRRGLHARGELPESRRPVIVILGGIGVSSVTRVFVQQKIRSIAILKCLGGRSGQLLAIYMAQLIVLGLAGSAFGVLLAALAIRRFHPHWPPPRRRASSSITALTGPAVCKVSALACSCRFCSHWCRSSIFATSSRRSCCAPKRPAPARCGANWRSPPSFSPADRAGCVAGGFSTVGVVVPSALPRAAPRAPSRRARP